MNLYNLLVNKLMLPEGIWKKIVLIGLAALFITVGIDHFVNPDFYLSIMPPAFPLHIEAVYISGVFEILGGIGVLIPKFRRFSGWGLVALLIAVYPANIYMAISPDTFPDIPVSALYFRLVLQFIFFYWAYSVTRPSFNPSYI